MMLSCWLHQGQDLQRGMKRVAWDENQHLQIRGPWFSTGKGWRALSWVGGEVLPQVEEFKYLGVLFTSEGKMEREIDRQIGLVQRPQLCGRCTWTVVVKVKKELSRERRSSRFTGQSTLPHPHLWS
ncbi:hypothetical protein L3Q82_003713 [Scortum barcoo]|uniref:Uncharacterized protein n=1 Tax=Scortum barcoo TaxID=214431 RepID=A0ACB8X781_9TELE|nr:hypothetical protein L3Q82_003713 [Scortum barcoo]